MPPVACVFLLAGCAVPSVNAPSLLPRTIESRSSAEPVRPPVAADGPGFTRDVAQRSAALDTAVAAFAETLRATEPRIARAGKAAVGSDAWIDAQAALTELGGARATTDAALADLEGLAIARASENLPPDPALDARIAAGAAAVDQAAQTLDRLQARVRPL